MIELGVNIDHVATLREARKGIAPDVIAAAKVCEIAGAHQITVHLRQDRRHIQDRDVELLREVLNIRMNLEMGVTDEIITIAHRLRPYCVCLVPENRREVTTEGGLDVAGQIDRMAAAVEGFHDHGIKVSMFIDPEREQVEASAKIGADMVELHTGAYAQKPSGEEQLLELKRIREAAQYARSLGLKVVAGHGLNYLNIAPFREIEEIEEVSIGHAIIARAVLTGLEEAVREMLRIIQ